MYAIVRIAGFQYLVTEGEKVIVPRLDSEPGSSVTFDDVLLVRTQHRVIVGTPVVPGASVEATVVDHPRGAKVTAFKFIRTENYRRKKGHRQPLTRIMISDIRPGSSS